MFSALCAVNASLQGRDTVMFEACDKLGAFSDNFGKEGYNGSTGTFHNLKNFIDAESIECTFSLLIPNILTSCRTISSSTLKMTL